MADDPAGGGRDYMVIVQRLLAQAQSTNHPAEADTFLAKAQQLMAEHAIDEAMLAAAGNADRATVGAVTIMCEAPYATPKAVLLDGISDANDCRAIVVTSGANRSVVVHGYDTDLAHVQALYTHLSLQATRAVLAEPVTDRRFRYRFLLGFADRVATRLEQARAQAQADYEHAHQQAGGSVAVVLAGRVADVEQAFRQAHPNRRKTRAAGSGAGVGAGQAAGDRADLGNGRLKSGPRGAIGRT